MRIWVTPMGQQFFDETGLVKKNFDSFGIAKQYCQTVGNVESSEVGAFVAYASSKVCVLLEK